MCMIMVVHVVLVDGGDSDHNDDDDDYGDGDDFWFTKDATWRWSGWISCAILYSQLAQMGASRIIIANITLSSSPHNVLRKLSISLLEEFTFVECTQTTPTSRDLAAHYICNLKYLHKFTIQVKKWPLLGHF